jgi:LacI family transcriptional regulator
MQRPTIRDVALAAGVSLGTVSNVLNHPEIVAADTRARVMDAIERIGFVRNHAARQLRGERSRAIALVVLDIDNPFFTKVGRGAEDAASEANHLLIVCSSSGDAKREDRHLALLEEHRVAGILMSPVTKNPAPRVGEIRNRGIPVVLLDRHRSRRNQCSAAVNDTSGGRLVAAHLAALGHTRIGLINGPRALKPCAERRAGFVEELQAHGLELRAPAEVETSEMTIAAGEAAAATLLGRRSRPTALFCANDLLAIGAEHAALARGVRVPEDVAIVGYDDIPYAAMSLVPLTSVRMPAYDLGYRAAKLLIDEATNAPHHHHERLEFEPELVPRQSTLGEAAGAGPRRPARRRGVAAV